LAEGKKILLWGKGGGRNGLQLRLDRMILSSSKRKSSFDSKKRERKKKKKTTHFPKLGEAKPAPASYRKKKKGGGKGSDPSRDLGGGGKGGRNDVCTRVGVHRNIPRKKKKRKSSHRSSTKGKRKESKTTLPMIRTERSETGDGGKKEGKVQPM